MFNLFSLLTRTPELPIKRFSFPDPPRSFRPSAIHATLERLQLIETILSGTLPVLMVVIFALFFLLLYKADMVPYVADGDIFGCQVRVSAHAQ